MSTVKISCKGNKCCVSCEGHTEPRVCNQLSTIMFALYNYAKEENKIYHSEFSDGKMVVRWKDDSPNVYKLISYAFQMMGDDIILKKE